MYITLLEAPVLDISKATGGKKTEYIATYIQKKLECPSMTTGLVGIRAHEKPIYVLLIIDVSTIAEHCQVKVRRGDRKSVV